MPIRIDATSSKHLRRLLTRGQQQRFLRGEPVYAQNDPADALYAVLEGRVRLTTRSASREITVAVAGPTELFGEEALVPEARRPLTARATEPTTAVRIAPDAALRAVRNHREVEITLIRACLQDLHEARRRAAEQRLQPVPQRLARLVFELQKRFGRRQGRGTLIPHWFTHGELADLIGAHRSTVTTTLGDWLYKGLVKERDHCLIIPDDSPLRAIAHGETSP